MALSSAFIIAIFLGILLFASIVSRRARLPYTLVLVFLGIGIVVLSDYSSLIQGSIIQSFIASLESANALLVAGGQGGLFVALVVPPLIFEALMHVKSRELGEVIRPSFALATAGVVIATVVGGLILWKIANQSFYISFLFAALISPTDVATVLEIFRRIKVPPKLAALMDTEAAFNDATGIVVFTIILASFTLGTETGSTISIIDSIANFVIVFAGGALVGLVVAFGAEVLTSRITDRSSEVILTVAAVYGSYALATALGTSGLVAVAVVGLYFGNYTIKKAIAPSTRESVNVFWEVAAFVGNSIAFLFIGLRTNILTIASSLELIGFAYLAVTLARLASVYPILTLFDRFTKVRIPLKWQNVAMLGGARGALSIALAVTIAPISTIVTAADINTISTMVLGVAFISISVQGWLLSGYIRRNFPEEQNAKNIELGSHLSKAVATIENIQKLKQENKISDQEFANELESGKMDLEEAIAQIQYDIDTTDILKARATELYKALVDPIESMLSRREQQKQKVSQGTEEQEKKNGSQEETSDTPNSS